MLSQALKKNTNLSLLYLYQNSFTPVGVKALLTGLFDSMSLNAVSESNHTCKLSTFNISRPIQELISSSLNVNVDRTAKCWLPSITRNLTGVTCRRAVGIDAICVGIYSEVEGSNSINEYMMYAAMSWWNMPPLSALIVVLSHLIQKEKEMARCI